MKRTGSILTLTAVALVLALALAPAALAATQYKYKILHTFTGGKDGGLVASGFTLDGSGNPYGMTFWGGAGTPCGYQSGCGVIFELSPKTNGHWTEKVLLDFTDDTGSGGYSTNLLFNSSGGLFGSTDAIDYHAYIFELTPGNGEWGFNPIYGPGGCLVPDQTGNLYGCIPPGGIGELSPGSNGWTYTDLSDQTTADAPLVWDAEGNLYGTDMYGGSRRCSGGCGTAFQMTPNGDGTWTYHVIHYFGSWQYDGLTPVAGLVMDAAGNAYGATWGGGTDNCGIAFKLEPPGSRWQKTTPTPLTTGLWKEKVLYNFHGYSGCGSLYTLALDSAGSLYGTANGGDPKCGPCGVIFKLAPQKSGKWKYSVLHTFHGPEGADPYGVILDSKGNIFGTAYDGGKYGYGVVFEITP
jgi:hypothetical protein